MKYLLVLLFSVTASATLNDVDKAQIFNKNILSNGGFENGMASWSISGGGTRALISSGDNLLVGKNTYSWAASGSSQYLTSTAVTIPKGMYGRNGVASCLIKTGSGSAVVSGDYVITAYDGSNILSSTSISISDYGARNSANFIFPSSGSLSIRFSRPSGSTDGLYIDDCYLGPAEGYNMSSVSQALFVGSAYFATTASCTFTRTNTALGSLSDTDCPGPTVEFNPGPGTIQTTDANAPVVTVNSLPPGYYEVSFIGGSVIATSAQLASLAINDGTTTSGQTTAPNLTTATSNFKVTGYFSYSTTANRSFELYASSAANAFNIDLTASNQRLYFSIKRFPASNEQAYRPDLISSSWSGYHASTCSWNTTSTSFATPTGDATCTLTEVTNQNFGTVSTATDGTGPIPKISFTPVRAGRYSVCATVILTHSVDGGTSYSRIIDNSSVELDAAAGSISGTGGHFTHKLCGIYVATGTSAHTATVQISTSTGTTTITDPSATGPTLNPIQWEIFQIDQNIPAPAIVNSVVSTRSAVTKINSADIATTGTVSNESGDWISGNCTNASPMVCTLNSGIYSATPHCWTSVNDTGSSSTCQTSPSSSTSVSLRCTNDAGSATTTSINKQLFCMGVP